MRTAVVRFFLILLTLGALTPASSAASTGHKEKHHNSDLADALDHSVILNKFAALVQASDLGTFLSSRGPFTLFAPTNSAFSKLPPGMYEDLLRPENKTQLQRVVLFHLINGKGWIMKDLAKEKSIPSCEGTLLPLKATRTGTVFVHKAKVMHADQRCTNGMLEEIDTLLLPPKLLLVAATEVPPPPAPSTNAPSATNAAPADTNAAPATTTNTAPEPATNAPSVPPAAPSMQ